MQTYSKPTSSKNLSARATEIIASLYMSLFFWKSFRQDMPVKFRISLSSFLSYSLNSPKSMYKVRGEDENYSYKKPREKNGENHSVELVPIPDSRPTPNLSLETLKTSPSQVSKENYDSQTNSKKSDCIQKVSSRNRQIMLPR